MAKLQLIRGTNTDTLINRVLVALVLLPPVVLLFYLGGWFFSALVALAAGLAADEFVRMLQKNGSKPASWITIPTAVLVATSQVFTGFNGLVGIFTAAVLVSMTYHLIAYEKGREQAVVDLGATLLPIIYIGWLGGYLLMLRLLPEGFWWLLTVFSGAWLADAAAYLVGVRIGRHKITKRLSPKKSWEGYLAGIPVAIIGTALLSLLWKQFGAGPDITPLRGAVLGGALALLTIFGDLGESMIKRDAGVKDSSDLLQSHGGVFDRIDSALWAGVIGYYLITLFF